ncbi:transglutaminase family protein [Pseudorhodobacter ferrugineus]|uniref:transglutaminase family protein n=1 Tax=Pseudorhodobacter ferrugineus TaxID=77008 RepID=UPI0003B44C53|nr:transglutaminase family protein [Pseudorhodobacter ferrugineus]
MLLTVDHVTLYRYSQPVRGVVQSHRLTPSEFDGQRTRSWQVTVSDGLMGGQFRDGAGDLVQAWTVQGPVSEIAVSVRGTVETTDLAGILRGHKERVPPQCYLESTPVTLADLALSDLSDGANATGGGLDAAHRLATLVADTIAYTPGSTQSATTAAEALAIGKGVCQDQAHALLAMARRAGIPARYVSGYLHASQDGSLHEAAHAWAELWLHDLGWVGFDPANRCCPDDRYIRLGSGLDALDAAPIKGIARGRGAESMDVQLAVQQNEQ